jgi:hypothetical protein
MGAIGMDVTLPATPDRLVENVTFVTTGRWAVSLPGSVAARESGGEPKGTPMTSTTTITPSARHRPALRAVTALVATYLGVSVLTLIVVILMRDNPAVVNTAVWIRGTIVVASAALMFAFALRALAGAPRAFLRVRIISAIMLVAIVVIIALPGTFPLWMKVEQAVCGLLLLGVVVLVNGRG